MNFLFVLTAAADVTYQTNEGHLPRVPNPGNRQVHGKHTAVLSQALHVARQADDACLARAFVVLQVAVVVTAVRFGHQHRHIAPQHFFRGIAKHVAGRLVERFHQSLRIDGDDSIQHIVKNGLRV